MSKTPTTVEYPDTIPAQFHRFLPYGAAALILEDGDQKDLALAEYYETVLNSAIGDQVAEEYRGRTPYEDCKPS